jgi:formylglycine-generating enzyme required for sulfatase activity
VEASKPFEITGTPRIFINGKQFKGIVAKEILEEEILRALGEDATAAKAAAADKKSVPSIDPAGAPATVRVSFGSKSYEIDAFEASKGTKGEAVSAYNQRPMNKVSWYDAKAACESAGKRLCTQEEWLSACQNAAVVDDDKDGELGDDLIEGTEFSYSDFYDAGTCYDKMPGDNGSERPDPATGKVAYTGNFPRCATPTGIFDMNGNVEEWVGESEDKAVLLGGYFAVGEKASCFRKQDTFGPGFANRGTGFRCCKD